MLMDQNQTQQQLNFTWMQEGVRAPRPDLPQGDNLFKATSLQQIDNMTDEQILGARLSTKTLKKVSFLQTKGVVLTEAIRFVLKTNFSHVMSKKAGVETLSPLPPALVGPLTDQRQPNNNFNKAKEGVATPRPRPPEGPPLGGLRTRFRASSLSDIDKMTEEHLLKVKMSGRSAKRARILQARGMPLGEAIRTVLKENFQRAAENGNLQAPPSGSVPPIAPASLHEAPHTKCAPTTSHSWVSYGASTRYLEQGSSWASKGVATRFSDTGLQERPQQDESSQNRYRSQGNLIVLDSTLQRATESHGLQVPSCGRGSPPKANEAPRPNWALSPAPLGWVFKGVATRLSDTGLQERSRQDEPSQSRYRSEADCPTPEANFRWVAESSDQQAPSPQEEPSRSRYRSESDRRASKVDFQRSTESRNMEVPSRQEESSWSRGLSETDHSTPKVNSQRATESRNMEVPSRRGESSRSRYRSEDDRSASKASFQRATESRNLEGTSRREESSQSRYRSEGDRSTSKANFQRSTESRNLEGTSRREESSQSRYRSEAYRSASKANSRQTTESRNLEVTSRREESSQRRSRSEANRTATKANIQSVTESRNTKLTLPASLSSVSEGDAPKVEGEAPKEKFRREESSQKRSHSKEGAQEEQNKRRKTASSSQVTLSPPDDKVAHTKLTPPASLSLVSAGDAPKVEDDGSKEESRRDESSQKRSLSEEGTQEEQDKSRKVTSSQDALSPPRHHVAGSPPPDEAPRTKLTPPASQSSFPEDDAPKVDDETPKEESQRDESSQKRSLSEEGTQEEQNKSRKEALSSRVALSPPRHHVSGGPLPDEVPHTKLTPSASQSSMSEGVAPKVEDDALKEESRRDESSQKRSLSEEGTQEEQDKMRKEASPIVKVAVAEASYPVRILNGDELEALKAEIVGAMERVPDDTEVSIYRCSFRPGYLLMHCANQQSADWLKDAVPGLAPWEGATLRVMTGDELPALRVVSAVVPASRSGHHPEQEEVLRRLAVSNRRLNTRLWTVFGKTPHEKGTRWTWNVDLASLEGLHERDMNPFYEFGRIRFTLEPCEGDSSGDEASDE